MEKSQNFLVGIYGVACPITIPAPPPPIHQGYTVMTETAMFSHILTIVATTNSSEVGAWVNIGQSPPLQLTVPWVSSWSRVGLQNLFIELFLNYNSESLRSVSLSFVKNVHRTNGDVSHREEKPVCPKNKRTLREQQIRGVGEDLATFKAWFHLVLRPSCIHALLYIFYNSVLQTFGFP